MSNILITGGAGFLGLNIALEYLNNGHDVVIIDDLKNAYIHHVNHLKKHYPSSVTFYKGDVCDKAFLDSVFQEHSFDTVLHLAAYKNVAESKMKPSIYYINNISSLRNVLRCIDKYGVKKFAFPSTAMVYGNVDTVPTSEECRPSPLSPYAETKVEGENIISTWHESANIPAVIFRFSNPIGANTEYGFGDHSKKGYGNLIPYIVSHAISHEPIVFRGNDHPTPDGTAVRDYIHISDLASTVYKVLDTKDTSALDTINVGSGKGTSVLDIVRAVEVVLGEKIDYSFSPRNEYESSISILDTSKLKNMYSISIDRDIVDIVKSEVIFYNNIHKEDIYEDTSR